VVSVPEDSDRQKVRVYRYVVHEEIENPYDLVPKYEAPVYYDSEGNVYDEDVFGDGDYDDYETWDEDEWTSVGGPDDSNLYSEKGVEGKSGNPCEDLVDFDDPQRSESIIAGCIRQSTDNPLKKNSFETDDIVGDVDVDMFDIMYNNANYATGQPSEKNSLDVVEETNKSDSFTLPWDGTGIKWDIKSKIKDHSWDDDSVWSNIRRDWNEWKEIHSYEPKNYDHLHPDASEIIKRYEDWYGIGIEWNGMIDTVIYDDLRYALDHAGFDANGNKKEDPNQTSFMEDMFQDTSCYAKKSSEKNSFDVVEKDSNEETVIDVERPNNIILPDNN
jgi:hypothetical protein